MNIMNFLFKHFFFFFEEEKERGLGDSKIDLYTYLSLIYSVCDVYLSFDISRYWRLSQLQIIDDTLEYQ